MQLKAVFVQNLRKYRKSMGISQMELAELCETSTSYIGQIEIENRFPSIEMIEKIAEALQVKPYLLFSDELDKSTTKKQSAVKTVIISDSMKDELISRLNIALRKIIKKINDAG
jgi:transcriptional regulator with XRE-family HTH domain